jgi:hypothetical protein
MIGTVVSTVWGRGGRGLASAPAVAAGGGRTGGRRKNKAGMLCVCVRVCVCVCVRTAAAPASCLLCLFGGQYICVRYGRSIFYQSKWFRVPMMAISCPLPNPQQARSGAIRATGRNGRARPLIGSIDDDSSCLSHSISRGSAKSLLRMHEKRAFQCPNLASLDEAFGLLAETKWHCCINWGVPWSLRLAPSPLHTRAAVLLSFT